MKGKEAMTQAERMRIYREKLREEGYRQVAVWLSPAAQLAVSETKKRLKNRGISRTQSEIVNDALIGEDY